MTGTQTLRPFVLASLGLHGIALTIAALLPAPSMAPPAARVVEVTLLPPKRLSPSSVLVPQAAPTTSPRRGQATSPSPKPKPPIETLRMASVPKPSVKPQTRILPPVSRKVPSAGQPSTPKGTPVSGPPGGAASGARRATAVASSLLTREAPRLPGSGTPAGPGRNPMDETPGGEPGGGSRLDKVRPGISYAGEQLAPNPTVPGGFGEKKAEPLPRGLPIGRRDAGVAPDPGLVARRAGGGAPGIGTSATPGSGPRSAEEPETVFVQGGAGGMHLPKARPRLGGGGGTPWVIATGPAASSDADTVPQTPRPGSGPGFGGGMGAGEGGGVGIARGRGIGVGPGAYDVAVLERKAGAGIGAGSGSGIGTGVRGGDGREPGPGEFPGAGGVGAGYGGGSGIGIGPGRGGAKMRPGVPGIPFGDIGGSVSGGNPEGGGGKGGGPGGPGTGVQVARRGGGGPGTGSGGSGLSRTWAGSGSGQGAGGRGIGPGTGLGTGAGAGTHPGSGAGGAEGVGPGGGRRSSEGTHYLKSIPGLVEWNEEILGRGFYPDGIVGTYYDDPDRTVDHSNPSSYLGKPFPQAFTRFVAKRKDPMIHFNWNPHGAWGDLLSLLAPMPGINNVWWSVRWEGQVFVPQDDVYTFKFDPLDDAARLYLRYRAGGTLEKVIDAWKISYTRPETRPFYMKRGAYDIRVEYAQGPEYYAAICLQWKSSSFDWEVIGPYRSGGTQRRSR